MIERVERWGPWIVLGALAAWLAAATALVRLEYFDGYDAILNARYLTGSWDRYIATRAPLVGLLLVPAQWLHAALAAQPLDARPYHVISGLLHAGYLGGSYLLLRRHFGGGWPSLVAFVAAVPTFVFFSYAPFVSHDIFPGLILVGMVVLASADRATPSAGRLCGLAALGAAAMLVKPVFGVFWVAILAGEAATRGGARRVVRLGVGALASLVVVLVAASAVTVSNYPEVPFALRGVRHLVFLATETHQRVTVEPVWIYLRNAWAYGPLAVVLALPGVVLSWRGDSVQRRMAVAWVVVVVAFHCVGVRQVRYLAFLGAVTAFVIVPAVAGALRRRPLAWAGIALLALSSLPLHPLAAGTEAARIALPMYRRSPAQDLLAPLETEHGRLRAPVYFNNWFALSFVPTRDTPFAGDLYHDVFHLADYHVAGLYGIPYREMIPFDPDRGQTPVRWPDEAALVLCSTPHIVNRVDWRGGPAPFRDDLVMTSFVARSVDLRPGGAVSMRAGTVGGREGVVLSGPAVAAIRETCPFASAEIPGDSHAVAVRFSDRGEAFVAGSPVGEMRFRFFERVAEYRNPRE